MSLILDALHSYHIASRINGEVGVDCEGSKYHSPTPLSTTQVDIASLVEPRMGVSEVVWLCGVCQDNVRIFVMLMQASDGQLGWAIRREFGNRIRDLGTKAWVYHQEGLTRG